MLHKCSMLKQIKHCIKVGLSLSVLMISQGMLWEVVVEGNEGQCEDGDERAGQGVGNYVDKESRMGEFAMPHESVFEYNCGYDRKICWLLCFY